MIERAYIHVSGPVGGCGQDGLHRALLHAIDGPTLCVRGKRGERARKPREASLAHNPELSRYRAAGTSDAARCRIRVAAEDCHAFRPDQSEGRGHEEGDRAGEADDRAARRASMSCWRTAALGADFCTREDASEKVPAYHYCTASSSRNDLKSWTHEQGPLMAHFQIKEPQVTDFGIVLDGGPCPPKRRNLNLMQ
ncbi:MAG: hypothetical protein HY744_22105 [Deltaproteobacteria bacterium]|nr:hypothetical protein [Deltaproteobacteria bacterium]